MNKKPGYLSSVVKNKCPRCRMGEIFESKNAYSLKQNKFMQMHESCPVCNQKTEVEVGFYYGTGYVSYALTIAISVATLIAWWLLIGFSLYDNRIFFWLALNSVLLIILMPPIMRLSRTLWLSWFVRYDPEWKNKAAKEPERIVEGQMNNW